MRELVGMQTCMYMADRGGAGQLLTLCASVVVPRTIDDGRLQAAANELFLSGSPAAPTWHLRRLYRMKADATVTSPLSISANLHAVPTYQGLRHRLP